MSAVVTLTEFRRAPGTLWRDTGLHVLVLSPLGKTDVVVLGGGGATVWRLLEQPRDLEGLSSCIAELDGEAPEGADLRTCLDELTSRHLVTAREASPS